MLLSKRATRLLASFVLVCFLYLVLDQYLYERFLDNRFITFDDFPTDYGDALQDAVERQVPLEFDYSRYPVASNPSSVVQQNIHFIWFKDLYPHQLDRPDHPSHIPQEGSEAPRLCTEYNPDFTINVWNASAARQLLVDHYDWFLPTYDGYRHPIQRVDAFKYFVIYHYGGVYMDLDIACRRALAPILQVPAWFPKASPFGLNNDLFAARQGHELMRLMIERLESRNWNLFFPYVTIFWTTGPQFASDMVRKWWHKGLGKGFYVAGASKKDSDANEIYVLPPEFYSERYTFFGHSPGGTWHGEDVATVLWLVDRPWLVFVLVSLCASCATMILYRRRRSRSRLAKLQL